MAHYTSGMLGALARAFPDDEWRAFVPGPSSPAMPPGVRTARHPLPSRALFGAAALVGRPRLDRLLGSGLDVVWVPAPAPLALAAEVPYVVTVHDLSWVQRPADFTRYERAWHRAARAERLARRARAVVAVSRATGDALTRLWGISAERIHVVSPGVPEHAPAAAPAELPDRFLLWVGALEPRKAPDVLARAFRRARRAGLDADLVVVGGGRLGHVFDGAGIHRLDGPLAPLYERALALVMPSHLEGFGFPPLEAALAGTPSVVSDLAVFEETLGDAALRVPAGDEGALADALVAIAGDERLRRDLAARARDRAARRTWDAAARELRAVLAEAAR